MSMKSRAVNVTSTRARLDTQTAQAGGTRSALLFTNEGTDTVYVGGDDVTDANGFPVASGAQSPGIELDENEQCWVVCASGDTATIRVLEEGL